MKHIKSKRVSVIIVIFAVAVAGLLTGLLINQDEPKVVPNTSSGPKFELQPTSGLSYKVTRTVQTENGVYTSIFERTTDGVSRATSKADDQVTAQVYNGEVTYSCTTSSCSRIKLDDNTMQSAYEYYPQNIKNIASTAKYKGKEACPAGMCNVWSWINDSGLQSINETLYIDQSTNRISQVKQLIQDGTTYTTTYEFIPITIAMPPSPTDLPSLP